MAVDEQVDLCIVGGAGHIGLPLGLVFASVGLKVMLLDINEDQLKKIQSGVVPFIEHGAEELLRDALEHDRLLFSAEPADMAKADTLIITIGTPVDEFLSPDPNILINWAKDALPYLQDDQLIVLCSTVYPGTTQWLQQSLSEQGKQVHVAFCPERIAQGHACRELHSLPKIVSGVTPEAERRASELFEKIAPETVALSPLEAEFAKLFTNSYRYIQFAAANQFYMIAQTAGVDYGKILSALKHNYDRAKDIPGPGFAAGPCLLKDTMQLAGFAQNEFSLGVAAMQVNEGLVLKMAHILAERYPLSDMTVGILGMAFKANNDDIRSSLSYKMKKSMIFRAKQVLCHDPYVPEHMDWTLVDQDTILEQSDLLIIMAPHRDYKEIDLKGTPTFDLWHLREDTFHI